MSDLVDQHRPKTEVKQDSSEVRVILVRPKFPRNVGSVSRAMTNMGFGRLILIGPQEPMDYEAQLAAATGQEPLQERIEIPDWQQYDSDLQAPVRIAFSARPGQSRPLWDLREVLSYLYRQHPLFQQQLNSGKWPMIDFIFGPEDHGLSNEDVDRAHFNCRLPVFGINASLNLSQAVLLALFIYQDFLTQNLGVSLSGEKAHRHQLRSASGKKKSSDLDQALDGWLGEMGLKSDDRRVSARSVMKRLLLQHIPTSKEARILKMIFEQNRRKLRELRQFQTNKMKAESPTQ